MTSKETEKLTLNLGDKKPFAVKVSANTLLESIRNDLTRVHEITMAQNRPTAFVLSDFNLQMKVVVTQENNQTVFALPTQHGEYDPNIMSTLNISLKPIPINIQPSLSIRPVEAVEGIGNVIRDKLRKVGIATISDLALASPQEVANIGVPAKKAAQFVSMAKLMVKSNIAGVEGVDEQVAELLVVGAKIDSKERLAQADPEVLAAAINDAVAQGKVKVPRSFKLTAQESTLWVNSAKTFVQKTNCE